MCKEQNHQYLQKSKLNILLLEDSWMTNFTE